MKDFSPSYQAQSSPPSPQTPPPPASTPPPIPYSTLPLANTEAARQYEQNASVSIQEKTLYNTNDLLIKESEPDKNGGREIHIIRTERINGAKKVGTVTLYVAASAYSIFLSSLFGFLSMLRNKKNKAMAALYFTSSWLANCLSSLKFIIDLPGIFVKCYDKDREFGWTYRACAAIGVPLGLFNTLAGLKLGLDAIYLSPYDDVRKLGLSAVGVFSANTLASRSVGTTTALFKSQAFIMQMLKDEWNAYEPLFTLLLDIERYGASLNWEEFSYNAKNNPTLTDLAVKFYEALAKKGIKPIGRSSEAILKVWETLVTPLAVYGALTLAGMWTSVSAAGLNAIGQHFKGENWGNDFVPLSATAAVASVVLYGRFGAIAAQFAEDVVSLPFTAGIYHQGKNSAFSESTSLLPQPVRFFTPTRIIACSLGALAFAGAVAIIGWGSGAGMEVEATSAVLSNYNNLTFANSTLFEVIRAPARPVESFLGNIAQLYAGEFVNMGATNAILGRFFRTGTKFYQTDNRGINDLMDWVIRALDTRTYLGPNKETATKNLRKIYEARMAWAHAENFTWCGLFQKCSKKKYSYKEAFETAYVSESPDHRIPPVASPSPTPLSPSSSSSTLEPEGNTAPAGGSFFASIQRDTARGYQAVESGSDRDTDNDLHVDSSSESSEDSLANKNN